MASEPDFTSDGGDDLDARWEVVVRRMAEHARSLALDDASEEELDRLAVELVKSARR
jgi:hypothetical protein